MSRELYGVIRRDQDRYLAERSMGGLFDFEIWGMVIAKKPSWYLIL